MSCTTNAGLDRQGSQPVDGNLRVLQICSAAALHQRFHQDVGAIARPQPVTRVEEVVDSGSRQ